MLKFSKLILSITNPFKEVFILEMALNKLNYNELYLVISDEYNLAFYGYLMLTSEGIIVI